MARIRIVYNRKGCIASGHCVLSDPFNFELDEEFRAILKDAKPMGDPKLDVWYKDIETDVPHMPFNAMVTCTPKVIAVIDLETGKKFELK